MNTTEITKKYRANWTMPSPETMRADFDEYKKKELSKWEGRAKSIGARFPIFNSFEDFVNTIKSGQIINAPLSSFTHCSSIEEIESMVSAYIYPRDVQRIVDGFETGAAMPYPIILQGKIGQFRLSGNTRSNVAWLLKLPVKALLVNVK